MIYYMYPLYHGETENKVFVIVAFGCMINVLKGMLNIIVLKHMSIGTCSLKLSACHN